MAKFALSAAAELSAAAQFEQCCASACDDALAQESAKESTATPPESADREIAADRAFVFAVHNAFGAHLPSNLTERESRRAQARAVHLLTLLKSVSSR